MTDDVVWCEGYSDDCQADKYRARIAELEDQVEKLHYYFASCIASGREQRTKIAALEAALADAERRPEQREIRELRAERDGLRQQLEAARFGCKALEAEAARLKEENAKLRQLGESFFANMPDPGDLYTEDDGEPV